MTRLDECVLSALQKSPRILAKNHVLMNKRGVGAINLCCGDRFKLLWWRLNLYWHYLTDPHDRRKNT